MRASVVVLAYGDEPTLARCIDSLSYSTGIELDIVVVDNGAPIELVEAMGALPNVRILRPPTNLGFAGGCNHGAASSDASHIVLLNSDAFVEPDTIATICAHASRDRVGMAMPDIVLDDEPELLNTNGNPVHVSGLTWAGGYRRPADRTRPVHSVPTISGCCVAIRRSLWEELGGFDDSYFAYLEDTDLSLRVRMRGLDLVCDPRVRARHAYEFSRSANKFQLLERNRLQLLATHFETRTLVRLAPVLLVVELAMLAQAVAGGWLRQKLAGYAWIARHVRPLATRRSLVQATRVESDRDLLRAGTFVSRIEPDNISRPPGLGLLNVALGAWCRVAVGLRD